MNHALRLFSCGSLALCLTLGCDGTEAEDSADATTNASGDGDGDGDGDASQPCGTEWAEKTDPSVASIMDVWGAPCTSDDECVAIIGDGATCVTNILGVYDLPGGFCSIENCQLPDTNTTYIHDATDCDPDGGVTCVGAKDLFTACIIPCTSNDECGREGYGCRTMPTLASEGDPTFCLMSPADCCTTTSGECAE